MLADAIFSMSLASQILVLQKSLEFISSLKSSRDSGSSERAADFIRFVYYPSDDWTVWNAQHDMTYRCWVI
ncbi:unnamed protein product [Toxocara canis]|uniref:Secreted protein n=1 Tax=Toxocara canis TaxID=6265 RepID=A0A183V1N9_TOXCA|nr:unnamed protein product [Toxocara canis]